MDYTECWFKDVCENTCSNSCIRFKELLYLVEASGLPRNRYIPDVLDAGEDYDAFCQLADIKDNISTFVEDGKNLYITSAKTGNGKTSWSVKLLLKYFDQVWAGNGYRERGLFVHVPTLIARLKDFENPVSAQFKQMLMNVDLVVWDDIASTSLSAYDFAQLLVYLDSRLFSAKSNIFTGNLCSKQALETALGSKLASRIWETSLVIELVGNDRRNNKYE